MAEEEEVLRLGVEGEGARVAAALLIPHGFFGHLGVLTGTS